jgi:hypothetical protein|tara:strand:- start:234 stop:488 length:255 start_codon:yes stop_codon:yes gene_type:complete
MGIENTVMETKEDIKIREILEKEEPLQKKKKVDPQFGLGQVPNYGKSRSGREYGGFIKDSVRKKMEFKPTNRGRKLNEKGPYDI